MKSMNYSAYAEIDAVNWSTLKEIRRSPLHYLHRKNTPRADSTTFARGRAGHTAVLEPMRFLKEYALFDGPRRAGKKWEEFKADHPTKTILKHDEYDAAVMLAAAVRSHPRAIELLSQGKAEQCIEWTDRRTGLRCKGRPDWLRDGAIVDLKTTGNVDAELFGRIAGRLGHHIQLCMYRDGVYEMTGRYPDLFMIAAETDAPHDVAVMSVNDDALAHGEHEYREMMDRLAGCIKRKEFPGRYPTEVPLILPPWLFDDENMGGLDLVINGHNHEGEHENGF